MLVRFDSKVGTITMFGDAAVTLLKMMGHSGTVPSALLAADLPRAITRLEQALAAAPPPPPPPAERDEQPQVSLKQRAFPLLELMRRAVKAEADLLWDKA
jgi:hypothetical protein